MPERQRHRPDNPARCRRWRERNPDKAKQSNAYSRSDTIKRRYGITEERYQDMLSEQRGGCKICGRLAGDEQYGQLRIDHNPSTGVVRGLLCAKHNMALGLFSHDPVLLREAALYLETTDGKS